MTFTKKFCVCATQKMSPYGIGVKAGRQVTLQAACATPSLQDKKLANLSIYVM